MNDIQRRAIFDFLVENRLVDVFVEEKIVSYDYKTSPDEEMGVTSSGIEYPKKVVMKYITDHGYPITEESVELVARKLKNEGALSKQEREKIYYSSIDNATDEELRDALGLGIAKLLREIRDEQVYNVGKYNFQYHISYFGDNSDGILPVDEIVKDITEMKANGWSMKNMFTKNSGIFRKGAAMDGMSFLREDVRGVLYILYEKKIPVD